MFNRKQQGASTGRAHRSCFHVPAHLLESYTRGRLTSGALARLLGVSPPTVRAEMRRRGLDTSRSRGIDLRKLVEWRYQGMTLRELAKHFGLSQEGVRQLLNRAGVATGRYRRRKASA